MKLTFQKEGWRPKSPATYCLSLSSDNSFNGETDCARSDENSVNKVEHISHVLLCLIFIRILSGGYFHVLFKSNLENVQKA